MLAEVVEETIPLLYLQEASRLPRAPGVLGKGRVAPQWPMADTMGSCARVHIQALEVRSSPMHLACPATVWLSPIHVARFSIHTCMSRCNATNAEMFLGTDEGRTRAGVEIFQVHSSVVCCREFG